MDPKEKLPASDRGERDNRSVEQSNDENLVDVDPSDRQRLPGIEGNIPEPGVRLPGRGERLPGKDQRDTP